MEIAKNGGSGTALTVTDGVHSVSNVSTLDFLSGATVSDGGGGAANVTIVGGGSGISRSVISVSSPTTAGATALTDYVYLVTGTTTLTLPTAVGNTNLYTIKNVGVATVTIATTSAQTIDGSTTASLRVKYTSLGLISDNANWNVV